MEGAREPVMTVNTLADEVDEAGEPSGPMRRCLASREVRPKAELLRFVVGPDDRLIPDPAERLPGRGLWLTPRRDIVAAAAAKGLFAKAAGGRVVMPADLAGEVESLLSQRCLGLLGLARRAGMVRTGFEKVHADLKAGRAGLLLAASDGAADGRAKLAALAAAAMPPVPVVALFDSETLSAALGHEGVVHASLVAGGMAARLLREVGRLAGMQELKDGDAGRRRQGPK
jgi:predicted RNA-binding protein YlxR (DUF448 family)